MSTSLLAFAVSLLALVVSVSTAWLTLLRRGEIRMTRPTVVYFGPDGGAAIEASSEKVFIRTMLYTTGKRGHIIENIFVRLRCGETSQNFNIWAYGDKDLSRGSGLYVPETGIATNHHFLLPPDGTSFRFTEGSYKLEIFVTIFGKPQPQRLFEVELDVPTDVFRDLDKPGRGIYFDWGPDAGRYFAHARPPAGEKFETLLRDKFVRGGHGSGVRSSSSIDHGAPAHENP